MAFSDSDSDSDEIDKQVKKVSSDEKLRNSPLFSYLRDNIPEDGGSSYALFSSGRGGKTTLLTELLRFVLDEDYDQMNKHKCKPIIIIMTTSKHAIPFEKLDKKDVIIYGDGHSKQVLGRVRRINKKHNNRYHFVIAYDDVVDTAHKNELKALFLTDRNKRISSAVSTQHIKLVGPGIRTTVNRVFLGRFFGREGVETACDLYLRGFVPRDWKKTICYDFYEWHNDAPGKFFLLNFLDCKVMGVDQDRNITPIKDLIQQFIGRGGPSDSEAEQEEYSE